MNQQIFKKCLAVGMAVSIGLSSWSNVSFADTPATGQQTITQIQSVEEFIPFSQLKLSNGRNLLMDDWKFNLGEVGSAEQIHFDDSKWQLVNLPHDYSIHQEYTTGGEAESAYLPGGIGWYRKTLNIPADLEGKRIFVDFDGVYMNAEVYLNGVKLGEHPYGYTAFSFDLTNHIRFGEENTLAVKVNNNIPTSRWYSGSGIYRNVYLNVQDQVHVEKDGIIITTPDIETNRTTPKVVVVTKIQNHKNESATVKVEHKIRLKGSDNVISTLAEESLTVEGNKTKEVKLEKAMPSVQLWQLNNPNLYEVETTISQNDNVLNTYKNDFGFRYFKFEADKGFSLNGENVKLQGVCMHHDQGSLGSAAYAEAISRQLDILKAMGVNAIRASHNPMSEDFVRLTNEKGLLLIQEAFDTWTINKNTNMNDYGDYFKVVIPESNKILGKKAGMTWGEFDTKAMVKRDRNAPSIIMWSTGNEVFEGNYNGQPTGNYPNVVTNIVNWMKAEDDTRPATIGDNKIKNLETLPMQVARNLHGLDGIIGYNYASETDLEAAHRNNPTWKIYASETSSAVNSRGIYTTKTENKRDLTLTSYDNKTVNWGQMASQDWYNVIRKDYVAGNFVWTGFDYMGEPTPWNWTSSGLPTGEYGIYRFPAPKSSYFGIVDLAGFPKDRYYFYSSQWKKDATTLHLLPAWHQGIINGNENIVVYSNAPEVKLFFTPKSTGVRKEVATKKMTEHKTDAGHVYRTVNGESGHQSLYYKFTLPYQDGKVEVEAYNEQGKKIEKTFGRNMVETFGEATQLKATESKKTLTANGRDLSYIEIDVLDAEGKFVATANDDVKVTVSGAGELVAMDNGRQSDMEKFNAGHRNAFSGKVLAIVRSKKENGVINVNISASGLQGTKLTLQAVNANQEESEIKGFRYSKNYYVTVGSSLKLPDTVKVVSGASETAKTVTWDTKDVNEKLKTPQTFRVKGTVEGGHVVFVNVQVLNEVVDLLNYSGFTRKGVVPNLPAVRPAVDVNNEVLDAFFAVTWKSEDLEESDFANTGIVKVGGTASVFGKNIDVEATIRVVEAQVEYFPSVTKDALEVRFDNNVFANKAKLHDNNKEETAINTANGKALELTYATAAGLGRVVLHYKGTKPQANLSWSLGSGMGYSPLNAKVTEETNQLVYDFQGVSAVSMKIDFLNNADITEVELVPATEKVTVNSTAELEKVTVNGVPVQTHLLKQDEIPSPQTGVVVATGKDNASVTVLPTKENKAVLVIVSEDGKTVRKQTVVMGQGLKDSNLAVINGAKAFAYFTNDEDPNSKDRIANINDGNKVFNGDATIRWSDWQREDKLRENYVGIILPKQGDIVPTISQVMFMPFKDRGTQKPSEMEIQVYTGGEFENPKDNQLSQLKKISEHALAKDSNWETVRTVAGSEIKDKEENLYSLPEAKETRAVRFKMKQDVNNQSLAIIEVEVFGKYEERKPELISQNVDDSGLPKAIASFTNDPKVDNGSADRIHLINDGKFGYTTSQPANRWTNWQHQARTGNEWVGILFGKDQAISLHKVSSLDLSFFEDTGCKVPESFKVQYFDSSKTATLPVSGFEGHVNKASIRNKDGGTSENPNKDNLLADDANWKDVENVVGKTTASTVDKTGKNTISFKPVTTYAIRILMTPQTGKSLAVTELEVMGYEVGGTTPSPQPQPQPRKDENLKVFPSLREYTVAEGEFAKENVKRIIIVDNGLAQQNKQVLEAAKLVSQEFAAYEIPSTEMLPILFTDKAKAQDGDIVIELKSTIDGVVPAEGFTIAVGKQIVVEAKNANGVMYALRTIMQYLKLYGNMAYGTIKDYPDTDERALHLDMGRKYFTPEWIKRTIREMSFMRLNTIQLHFSEHEGFRLQSEVHPDVLSKDFITKEEMKGIIAEAKKYGVDIIPSFDNPGHLTQALKNYPQYQIYNAKEGKKNVGALDINNDEARQFVKDFLKEYAELFADSKYFHIGGDEFIDFTKFTEYPSMKEFGQRMVGSNATEQDGYMSYIKEIAEYVHNELGFIPRVWNDGVYRSNLGYSVTLPQYVQVCYWTQWDWHMPTIKKILDHNHELINVNDKMYYVLTTEGRAYYNKPQANQIYRDIEVLIFPDKAGYRPPKDKAKGLTYAIWCDVPEQETEKQVTEGIYYSLRAMAEKSWAGKQENGRFSKFEELLTTLKAIYDPMKKMPEVKEPTLKEGLVEVTFTHIANTGQVLGKTEARIGQKGSNYSYEAPTFKGFKFKNSSEALKGTFDTKKEITLKYEKTTQKEVLENALANQLDEANYITETFAEYKAAIAKAEELLNDQALTDVKIGKAISEIKKAEANVVKKVFEPVYNMLKTPKPAGDYTNSSYHVYIATFNALKEKLKGKDVEDSKLEEFKTELANAEKGLVPLGDQVEITTESSLGTYYDPKTKINHDYSKLFDGDKNSFAWTNREQKVDDHFTFRFSKPVILSQFKLQYPDGVGSDYIAGAVLEGKVNDTWVEFGNIKGAEEQTITVDNQKVSEVRIRLTAGIKFWAKLGEVIITYKKVEETDSNKKLVQDAIANAEQVKASNKYKTSSEARQKALDDAVVAAQELLKQPEVTQELATMAVAAIDEAIEGLDGVENPQPPVVNKEALKEAIAKANETKGTVKYTKASEEKKTAFDTALSEAEETDANANAEQNDVNTKADALRAATEALDGEEDTPQPPQPQPQPQPSNDVLLPYIPEVVVEQPVVEIEEEEIALSSAEDLLRFNQLTENMTKEADKELVQKLIANKLTNKEFAKAISEEAMVEFTKTLEATYSDVKADDWYAPELALTIMLSLIKGYEDGTFRPENDITGQEFVTILVRAAGQKVEEDKTNWFKPYKEAAEKAGLLENVSFDLTKQLTRQEVAFLAYNFLKMESKNPLLPNRTLSIKDKALITSKYEQAITVLYEKDILKGYEDDTYKPMNNVKRAEALAIINRLLKK